MTRASALKILRSVNRVCAFRLLGVLALANRECIFLFLISSRPASRLRGKRFTKSDFIHGFPLIF